MTKEKTSADLEFEEKISGGRLFDSWRAVEKQSGRSYFVKKPTKSKADLASEKARKSFAVLRELKHPNILQPTCFREEHGGTMLLYPYFELRSRESLTPQSLAQYYPWLIPKICALLDFIHCRGYVHCDIKESNFILLKDDRRPRVFLTDFDFVTEAGSRLNKMIYGAPGHIAPEILYDDIVLTQSDHYSFGVMLLDLIAKKPALVRPKSRSDADSTPMEIFLTQDDVLPEFAPLVPFVSALLAWDASERPSYLGQLLRNNSGAFVFAENKYDARLVWSVARAIVHSPDAADGSKTTALSDFTQKQLKLVGVPDEILADADAGLIKGSFPVLKSLKSLMEKVKISRIGEYWFVNLDPEEVFEFYRSAWSPLKYESPGPLDSPASIRRRVREALRFKIRSSPWKALLLVESLLKEESQLHSDDATRCRCLLHIKAGQLSRNCGLAPRSDEHFRKALEDGTLTLQQRIRLLLTLANPNLISRDPVLYLENVKEARSLARQHGLLRERIAAFRRKISLAIARGRLLWILPRLRAVVKIASLPGLEEPYSHLCNQLGIALKDLGHLAEAKDALREGIRALSAAGSFLEPLNLYGNLAGVQFALGEYRESIESAGTALKFRQGNADSNKFTYPYLHLASCYTIAADYNAANLNALRLLDVRIRARYVQGFGEYYLKTGWIDQRRGDYDRSYVHLKNALRIFIASGRTEYLSRAKYHLAVLSFWRGKLADAERLTKEAEEIFSDRGDRVSESDAKLLLLRIAAERNGQEMDAAAVLQVLQTFTEIRNYLGSMSCILHLATTGYHDEAEEFLRANDELRDHVDNAEIPLAEGVRLLLIYWSSEKEERTGDTITALKKCYQVFESAHLYYDAAAIAELIARHYDSLGNPKLAIDYLETAVKLARRFGNDSKIRSLHDRIGALKRRSAAKHPEKDMLLEISELLNSVGDHKIIQTKLLRYAINATGAERGVLLLFDSLSGRLRVETCYDCDRQSIGDIEDISNTIVDIVYSTRDPYLIDDATKHRATRDRKSIIQHNILSIAAVPLLSRNTLVGVLYLDHHILTGKFTSDDQLTIKAVGHLIAVALRLSGHIRNLEAKAKEDEATLIRHGIKSPIITKDRGMLDLLDRVQLIANSPISVYLQGETGTGKELLAKQIHDQSSNSSGPYIAVNCALHAGDIGVADHFGINKGVATNVAERQGYFEMADGGTLFLDEIADLDPGIQGSLLRVLDHYEVTRIGGSFTKQVDFRLISASAKDLSEQVKLGKFREDLYYRITGVKLKIPPLRERHGDIPLLVEHFISTFGKGKNISVSREAMAYLNHYSWPGNVRELREMVRAMVIFRGEGVIDVNNLPEEVIKAGKRVSKKLKQSLEQTEEEEIIVALKKYNGNQSAVARELGMSLTTFRRRLRKYGIDPDDYKTA